MGAILELTIFSHIFIDIDTIIHQIQEMDHIPIISEIRLIDDWVAFKYERMKTQTDNANLSEIIEGGKIVEAIFKIDDLWQSGCHLQKIDDDLFETHLWFDIENLHMFDTEKINLENLAFIEMVTRSVISHSELGVVLAGIGIEVILEYIQDVITTINSSQNVMRWIIPVSTQISLNRYTKDTIEGFTILTREY